MARYRLTLEYDGGGFVGWQRQTNGLAVQQVLEEAITGFSGETRTVIGAGRTDSGVHALGMVASVDIDRDMSPRKIRDALNFHVRPHPVGVLSVEPAPDDFSARFDCTGRHYLYRVLNRDTVPVLDRGRVWHVSYDLDLDAMREAARLLIGKHDFESFRSTHCQSETALKTLDVLTIERAGPEYHLRCSARSFLHNQVRIFAGTLIEVGKGRFTPGDVQKMLDAKDRAAAGPTAPAHGLYFVKADYP
ncbi:tRNA pseudouridine(38-40) synthase TruA [Minwuia sp.]|uniref:tRNA pseudouridine(38-40) synthase TruA n=1 Tax=Minwuia sp. TaxID=2493630 RepID=UPI003A939A98